MNENTTTRSELEADIIDQVKEEIREALFHHAPQSWSQEKRDAVEKLVAGESRLVLDALSKNELGSTGALRTHIGRAIDETKRLIHQGGAGTNS